MKTYAALVNRLLSTALYGGVKLGLQNARFLSELLDHPEQKFPAIHVAGTNGKGSVCYKIARSLQLSGYKTGLFTSPHLCCFRERIQINGVCISQQEVAALLPKLFDLCEKEHIPATFFELTTLLAFLHFAKQQVDVAVIETGLGGRLDATNILLPHLTIITSVAYDHQHVLGNTLEQIASEKAGIIKPGVPVVIGPMAKPYAVFQKRAEELGSRLIQAPMPPSCFYDEENQSTAQSALHIIDNMFPLSDHALDAALVSRPSGRFEIFDARKHLGSDWPNYIVLDVAHNPDGMTRLMQALKHKFPERRFRFLVGISKDKDMQQILDCIAQTESPVHFIAYDAKGLQPWELQSAFLKICSRQEMAHGTIKEGLRAAKALAASCDEVLVVCGSFYIMKDVRQALGFDEPRDTCFLHEK